MKIKFTVSQYRKRKKDNFNRKISKYWKDTFNQMFKGW